jgi:hypothetical protein
MASQKLSADQLKSVLDGFHGVLKQQSVQQPVHVRFAAQDAPQCLQWDPESGTWRQVPC